MSTVSTTRGFGKKAIRNVAAAIVTAGVASAALAGPASADPLDLFTLDEAGISQFGTNCVDGGLPDNAELDWNENAAGTTVRPVVTGVICLQSTNRRARIALEYYDNSHVLLSRVRSSIVQGSAGGLATFAVTLAGNKVNSALMDHAHIVLEDDSSGTLAPVDTSIQLYP